VLGDAIAQQVARDEERGQGPGHRAGHHRAQAPGEAEEGAGHDVEDGRGNEQQRGHR
jgi:hypothetical protein